MGELVHMNRLVEPSDEERQRLEDQAQMDYLAARAPRSAREWQGRVSRSFDRGFASGVAFSALVTVLLERAF